MATWHIEGTTAVGPNLSHLATKAATAALFPRIETKMHAVCWAQCILFWIAPVPLNYIAGGSVALYSALLTQAFAAC